MREIACAQTRENEQKKLKKTRAIQYSAAARWLIKHVF